MSCPTCQVANRRIPSLPLGHVAKSWKSSGDIRVSNTSGLSMSSNVRPVTTPSRGTTPLEEDLEGLEEYLLQNVNIIEQFVMKNISQDQLERWLIKKSRNDQIVKQSKSGSTEDIKSLSNWKFSVHKDERKLLESLTKGIHQERNKTCIVDELVKNISKAIHASRHHLYLVDESGKYLTCQTNNQTSLGNSLQQDIESGATISTYVARVKKLVYVTEILGDERFPSGVGRDGTELSIICHPLCKTNGDLFGVVEFAREANQPLFDEEDVEVACRYLTWGSIAFHYTEVAQKLEVQTSMRKFVNKCISMIGKQTENILKDITDFGKMETNSEHFILYVWNEVNEVFDSEMTDFVLEGKPLELRIGRKSVPGEVSRCGKLKNVKNAYKDEYFSRSIDQKTGSATNTILAVPIILDGAIYGVLEYINKTNGVYTDLDEEKITLCASFYELAAKYQDQKKQIHHKTNEVLVLKDILNYHGAPGRKEVCEAEKPNIVVSVPDDFYKFSFNYYQDTQHNNYWFVTMAEDVLTKCKVDYCENTLAHFAATVKKHYRDMPYHNWDHAFSVSHFMYVALQTLRNHIPAIEQLALFFGCICHDLDHRARNNAFVILTNHPLSELYGASVLENHHFYMAKHILDQPEYDIFKSFDKDKRTQLLELMKQDILATDLLEHFKHREILRKIVDSGAFDWKNTEHRYLACYVLMTNCDLCGSCKPFGISRINATRVFEEFYSQGDEELSLGFTPIPMFVRKNEMALNQIGFINGVVMPCVNILKNIIPALIPVEEEVTKLLARWEESVRKEAETNNVSENDIMELRIPGSRLQQRSLSFMQTSLSVD